MKKQSQFFSSSLPGRQTGAVMAVSLIILLMLTLIGITGMRSTLMQERMAGNDRDRNLAFELAESGLRDGELYLASPTIGTFSTVTNANGRYIARTDGTTWWSGSQESTTWASDGSGSASGSLPGVSYIIEELQTIAGTNGSLRAGVPGINTYYRVTARGVSGNSNAVVILQSIYKR